MKMKLVTRLTEEVEHQIEDISKMELGTNEYKVAMESVANWSGKINDLQKTENEYRENLFNQELEIKKQELEIEKHKSEKIDRWVKNLLTGIGIGAPIAGAIWANKYNWPKEETDVMLKSGGKKAMDFLLSGWKKSKS